MKNQKGFTLIELLLVLAIIGIISAIAVPALLGQRARARMQATRDNAVSIIGDLTSTLGELSDAPSERKSGLPSTTYDGTASSNQTKANDAVTYVTGKANFSNAKNPAGSGPAYVVGAAGTTDGAVYLTTSTASTTNDPVITITAAYHDAKGAAATTVKTVSVN